MSTSSTVAIIVVALVLIVGLVLLQQMVNIVQQGQLGVVKRLV